MAIKIWVEYTNDDALVCVKCANATFLEDAFGKLHLFCDIQWQENENGECEKFRREREEEM